MNRENTIAILQKILKIVRWTSIIFLCFFGLITILKIFSPLEFANDNSEYTFIIIGFYGFPIAVSVLILTGMIKRRHSLGFIITKIVLAIVGYVGSVFVITIMLFAAMCGWTTDKVFFENKQNPSTKIVQRRFGCGAGDSSPATIKVFKIREISSDFIWATKIDTTKIDKSEWVRINEP